MLGQLEGNAQPDDQLAMMLVQIFDSHVETEECHPSGSVGLSERTTSGQRLRSVEGTDIVQAQESSFKHVVAVGILSVDPPDVVSFSHM
jgi:hypothetical protein